MDSALEKIQELVAIRKNDKNNFLIEVDGGINDLTGKKAKDAGADILVAGSYLFGHHDFKQRVEKLKND